MSFRCGPFKRLVGITASDDGGNQQTPIDLLLIYDVTTYSIEDSQKRFNFAIQQMTLGMNARVGVWVHGGSVDGNGAYHKRIFAPINLQNGGGAELSLYNNVVLPSAQDNLSKPITAMVNAAAEFDWQASDNRKIILLNTGDLPRNETPQNAFNAAMYLSGLKIYPCYNITANIVYLMNEKSPRPAYRLNGLGSQGWGAASIKLGFNSNVLNELVRCSEFGLINPFDLITI